MFMIMMIGRFFIGPYVMAKGHMMTNGSLGSK